MTIVQWQTGSDRRHEHTDCLPGASDPKALVVDRDLGHDLLGVGRQRDVEPIVASDPDRSTPFNPPFFLGPWLAACDGRSPRPPSPAVASDNS